MFEFFQKGGLLMYPLFLCSVITFAVGIERLYIFFRVRKNGTDLERIKNLTIEKKIEEALILTENYPGPVTSVIKEALKNIYKPKSLVEEAVSLKGSLELKNLNKNLHILELIGRIAPLLGLLGTVIGMVNAFRTVSSIKGAVEPSILAGGIWEALLTTVAGLFVAIPAIVLHHFFEDRVKSIAFEMKHRVTEIVNILFGADK